MFPALKGISVIFSFVYTAADSVSCCGPKKSPRTSSIVQIIFLLLVLMVSEAILRNQKVMIGLDSFSNQRFIYLTAFGLNQSLYQLPC